MPYPTLNSARSQFDIREHLDKLEPNPKIKNKYICPVCGGDDLSVEPKTGKYKCFSNECDSALIREAVAPWEDQRRNDRVIYTAKKHQPKIELAQFPDALELKPVEQRGDLTIYPYSKTQRVERKPLPDGKKSVLPYHSGSNKSGKGDQPWRPYRMDEVVKSGKGKYVLLHEGEGCVEACRTQLRLVSFTFQGANWKEDDFLMAIAEMRQAGIKGVVVFRDNDKPGNIKALNFAGTCAKVGFPCIVLNPTIVWEQMPEKGDIVDWLQGVKMDREGYIRRLEAAIHASADLPAFMVTEQLDQSRDITAEVSNLIERDLSKSELIKQLKYLASEFGYSHQQIKEFYNERLSEVEQANNRDFIAQDLNKILQAKSTKLDIRSIIPAMLALPIIRLASWLNLRPECYLTALLTTVSTLHHTKTKLVLNRSWQFSVSPNLFAAVVAPSSQKKSPIVKAVINDPLSLLQKESSDEYHQRLQDWEEQKQRYEQLKSNKDGREKLREEFPQGLPKEPRQEIFYFTNSTGEGIINQVQAHPDKPLLYLKDELAGIFKSFGQYKGGRGSEQEDLLSFYDGTGGTVLRAGGVTADLQGLLLSIFGTIQPAVLEKLLKGGDDANGQWARFMFINQPMAMSEMDSDSGSIQLTEMLACLYRRINELSKEAKTYYLDTEAFELFKEAYNELERRRTNVATSSAMQNVWGKAEGRIGKIALNLHIIKYVNAGVEPPTYIEADTMQAAIALTSFYSHQVLGLYSELDGGTALSPKLAKIVEVASQAGTWIKARDIQTKYNSKSRPKPDDVRQWFKELALLGKGETQGKGVSLEYRNIEVVDAVDHGGLPSSQRQSLTEQEQQLFVDVVDFLQNSETDESSSPLNKTTLESNSELDREQSLDNPQIPKSPQSQPNVDTANNSVVDIDIHKVSTNEKESTNSIAEVTGDNSSDPYKGLENMRPGVIVKLSALGSKRNGMRARVERINRDKTVAVRFFDEDWDNSLPKFTKRESFLPIHLEVVKKH